MTIKLYCDDLEIHNKKIPIGIGETILEALDSANILKIEKKRR